MKQTNRNARSLKCKMESRAINNTITRMCMHVAVGQIWIQAALLDNKQEKERERSMVRRGRKKQKTKLQTISSEHQIHAGQIDAAHDSQIIPLLSHTAKKLRHASKLGTKHLTGC